MAQQLSQEDLQSVLKFAVDVAKKAGEIISKGSLDIRTQTNVGEKMNSVDLLTKYDVAVENMVKEQIHKAYPRFKFIGEETFSSEANKDGRTQMTDEPTFCVDPIDGTTNFVHGFPHCCISIGLISFKRPVLGVIYNPFLDQLYTATKGGGAFLTVGTRPTVKLPTVPPRPLAAWKDALVGIEWGTDRSLPMITKKADSFIRLGGDPSSGVERGQMAHSLRSLGSAALNYSLVAEGGLDVYWEIGTWPWDICAGAIIAQEAGCLVAGGHGSSFDNDVNENVLWGRKHIVIRAIGDTQNETGREAQKRLLKEFYDTVEDFPPQTK